MRQRFGLKTGDFVMMAVVLCIAVGLFLLPLLSGHGARAEIFDAETGQTRVISLSDAADYEVTSHGVHLTVRVAEGRVFVERSDCPDHVCQNTPAISRPGQSIVCVPAGVVIRVLGEGAVVDGVSG